MDSDIFDISPDQFNAIAHDFDEYINNAQTVIDEQMSKIATLTSQVKNLASDNKKLRLSNNAMSVKLASVSEENKIQKQASINSDPSTLNKINLILGSLRHSGFIKSASANANINEIISNPKNLLGLLEDISETFVDLGLLNADNNSKFANDEAADYLVNSTNSLSNKNDAGFLTSKRGSASHAASSFENNIRSKIAEENKAREESFLSNLNKSNY